MLIAFINLILNPYCLLFFFFFASHNQTIYFENTGTNTQKLKIVPYTIFSLVFAIVVLSSTYLIGMLLPEKLDVWEAWQPKFYLSSVAGWLVTILTLKVYFKGMEGNIMGFIFFPLLAISSLALLIVNIPSMFAFFDSIEYPELPINFWLRLLLHAFLPFYVLIFVHSPDKSEKIKKTGAEFIIASLLFQLIFFFISWVIVKLSGSTLTFSRYFGKGQSIVYYFPMFAGLFYYLLFILSKYVLSKNKIVEQIRYFTMVFISLLIIPEFYFYVQLIRQYF